MGPNVYTSRTTICGVQVLVLGDEEEDGGIVLQCGRT